MLYIVMKSVKNTFLTRVNINEYFFSLFWILKSVFFFQTLASDKEEEFEESAWKPEFENRKVETSDKRFGRAS